MTSKFETVVCFLQMGLIFERDFDYHKVASSNTSRLEAHAGFFRLVIKGIFDPYVV